MKKLIKLMTSDKALHFLYCFFIASFCWQLAIILAVAKEVYDICNRGVNKDNLLDLLADSLGIIIAIL